MGNVSLVVRRLGISKLTFYSWVIKDEESSSIRALPKDKEKE